MNPIEQLAVAFGEVQSSNTTENFEHFKAVYELRTPNPPEEVFKSLDPIFGDLKKFGIQIILTLKIDSYAPIRINSKNQENLGEKLQEFDEVKDSLKQEDHFELTIEIDKVQQKFLNIFSCDSFFSIKDDLFLKDVLVQWNKCLSEKSDTVIIWDEFDSFRTKNLEFINYSEMKDFEQNSVSKKKRSERIELRDKCCHFANASEICLIPEDFMLCEDFKNDKISRSFRLLKNALSICFLSDHSTIFENEISYRLNGYRAFSGTLNFDQIIEVESKEITEIYEWVYNGGDISDKIGIARNIISIHTDKKCFLGLQEGITSSIKSGYELYLKENVKQYIEIKNKISDFLHAQSDKASDLTKSMFNMFKTNIWTFSTFFVGVFLLRALNKSPVGSAFNLEVLLVSYLLLVVSFIYLSISVSELNTDRDRILNRYDIIKNRYKELLDHKDLDKIIDSEDLKKKDRSYVNKKRNRYIFSWIVINCILGIFVTLLYFSGASNKSYRELESNERSETNVQTQQNISSVRVPSQEAQPEVESRPNRDATPEEPDESAEHSQRSNTIFVDEIAD